ncbi:hypothetical protein QFC24_006506 [Naganishia onofrii]|uniref:Uncharacterized protein n=1 Tax=Naganishia onofrii TaxID=1851511 RepID=A0ACC2X1G0_9TREE|nr:hypothetical protein QFC24_006506 [Naganishia onofrii]
MATLEPERSTSRGSGSRKGKERAILSAPPLGSNDGQPQQHQQGYDQERAEYGYETQYQEPEYLTVDQPVPRRPLSSGDSYDRRQHQHQQRNYDNEQRGTYDSRGMDDPELGGVGNQQGLGVEDLSPAVGATGAYPPVSEEEAEERRIQEHLSKIAARDMARRKAARTSKLYTHPVPNHNNYNNGTSNTSGITTALGAAPAVVATTLASGLSRASTLLRNRTRRGQSGSTSSTSTGGRSYGYGGGGVGGNDYLGSEGGGGRAGAGTGGKQGRPGSMFGFWRIPSIDDSVAEEREEVRRGGGGGGWAQGEGDGEGQTN